MTAAATPEAELLGMRIGKVVCFYDLKGYGKLRSDAGETDIRVHYTAIISQRKRKTLCAGQRVKFELYRGPKGLYASAVTATR